VRFSSRLLMRSLACSERCRGKRTTPFMMYL
jgi:hypothetical protein